MRRSLGVRLSRAGFGLLAIWCLGCTSFDVLLDQMFSEQVAAGVTCAMSEAARPPSADGASAVRASPDESGSPSCECSHCVGAQSDATTVAVAPQPTPDTIQHQLGSALSFEREPLVPPPIGITV